MNEKQNSFEQIDLTGIGKKFKSQWIFKNVTLQINKGEKIAVTGKNGSGKSTFLQLLSGYISQSEGTVSWKGIDRHIPVEHIHHYISFTAPYLELIAEFTLEENVAFFSRYKPLLKNIANSELIEIAGLSESRSKHVKNFSSGMKQRCKLAMAFMADTPILLIDEPLTNLDESGYEWYKNMVAGLDQNRTVVLCSNQVKAETYFCDRVINIETYK